MMAYSLLELRKHINIVVKISRSAFEGVEFFSGKFFAKKDFDLKKYRRVAMWNFCILKWQRMQFLTDFRLISKMKKRVHKPAKITTMNFLPVLCVEYIEIGPNLFRAWENPIFIGEKGRTIENIFCHFHSKHFFQV